MTHQRPADEIAFARERADLARARFTRRLSALRDRTSPARLMVDAGDKIAGQVTAVKASTRRAIWKRPLLSAAIATAVLGYFFRKPLVRLSNSVAALGRNARDWHRRQQETDRNDT
jgi:hypothetical protein